MRPPLLDDTNVFVLFDVTTLFTKVLVDQSFDVILDKLEKDNTLPDRTQLTATRFRDLLGTCLKTT